MMCTGRHGNTLVRISVMACTARDEEDGGDGGPAKLWGRRGEHRLECSEADSMAATTQTERHGRR